MFTSNYISEEKENALINQLAEIIKTQCRIHNIEILGMSILLDDNVFVDGKTQNAQAVSLLVQAGATTATIYDPKKPTYCSKTQCTLTASQCKAAITLFNTLPTPPADYKPNAYCRG